MPVCLFDLGSLDLSSFFFCGFARQRFFEPKTVQKYDDHLSLSTDRGVEKFRKIGNSRGVCGVFRIPDCDSPHLSKSKEMSHQYFVGIFKIGDTIFGYVYSPCPGLEAMGSVLRGGANPTLDFMSEASAAHAK